MVGTYKATVASEPSRPIVIFRIPAEDQAKWLTLKGVTMASDAVGAEPRRWDFPMDKLGGTRPKRLAPAALRFGSVGKTTSR